MVDINLDLTSIFLFGLLLPKLDKLWISQKIYNIINSDYNTFKSDSIATIGYNEPSLIFYLGTDTTVIKGLNKDFFEKKLYKYIIVEKKYMHDFKSILNNSKYEYFLLNIVNGFNMAKSKWVNVFIFKIKKSKEK